MKCSRQEIRKDNKMIEEIEIKLKIKFLYVYFIVTSRLLVPSLIQLKFLIILYSIAN
jgi:hypothetical protein